MRKTLENIVHCKVFYLKILIDKISMLVKLLMLSFISQALNVRLSM